jgi:hypothetical protein
VASIIDQTSHLNENYLSLLLKCFGISHSNLCKSWGQSESQFLHIRSGKKSELGWANVSPQDKSTWPLPVFVPSASEDGFYIFKWVKSQESNTWALMKFSCQCPYIHFYWNQPTQWFTCCARLLWYQGDQVAVTETIWPQPKILLPDLWGKLCQLHG